MRETQIPVSAVCQAALERAVRDVTAARNAEDAPPYELPGVGLYGRFTPRARKVMSLAQDAARRAKHGQVGTEHVLIGILDEGDNLAVTVLADLEVDADALRAELQASMAPAAKGRVKGKTEGKTEGHLPFTPLSKRALELTAKEALRLGHNYVGSEHLLLGLLATEEGMASKVLRRMGIELRTTRQAVVLALYAFLAGQARQAGPPVPPESNQATLDQILSRLDAIERRLSA